MSDNVVVRPAKREDKGFILSTWLKGNYWGNTYFNQMEQDSYFEEYSKHIVKVLSNPDTRIDVAVLSDEPDMDIGFVVYRGDTIFWAYVKRDYRGKGIADLLTRKHNFKYAAATTKIGAAIIKKKKLKFNPIGE